MAAWHMVSAGATIENMKMAKALRRSCFLWYMVVLTNSTFHVHSKLSLVNLPLARCPDIDSGTQIRLNTVTYVRSVAREIDSCHARIANFAEH